eukprot:972413-Rhodomonas_salina.1
MTYCSTIRPVSTGQCIAACRPYAPSVPRVAYRTHRQIPKRVVPAAPYKYRVSTGLRVEGQQYFCTWSTPTKAQYPSGFSTLCSTTRDVSIGYRIAP